MSATPPTAAEHPPSANTAAASPVAALIQRHGDLVYDLCESVLWSPANAQLAFRAITQRWSRLVERDGYRKHERAWALRIACDVLRPFAQRYGRRLAPSEQVMLDGLLDQEQRLRQLDSYFHRLPAEEQMLLILHDKHRVPTNEAAVALGIPEATLHLRRRQALRTLEEWIWNET